MDDKIAVRMKEITNCQWLHVRYWLTYKHLKGEYMDIILVLHSFITLELLLFIE